MATRRPSLNTDTFLGHLFSPAKNALPTGLRKHPVAAGKGRKNARVAAYNRMTPFKQEVLRRSGQREAYLRGEASFRDAKEALRGEAVEKRYAKPLRTKKRTSPTRNAMRRRLDTLIADRIRINALNAGKKYSLPHIIENVQLIPEDDYEQSQYITYPEMKHKGRKGSEYEVIMPDGTTRNPYWYH